VALGRGSELQLDMALANEERRGSCSTSVVMAHGSKKASAVAFAVRFGSAEKIKGEGGGVSWLGAPRGGWRWGPGQTRHVAQRREGPSTISP
jgi:hypothetical protein